MKYSPIVFGAAVSALLSATAIVVSLSASGQAQRLAASKEREMSAQTDLISSLQKELAAKDGLLSALRGQIKAQDALIAKYDSLPAPCKGI